MGFIIYFVILIKVYFVKSLLFPIGDDGFHEALVISDLGMLGSSQTFPDKRKNFFLDIGEFMLQHSYISPRVLVETMLLPMTIKKYHSCTVLFRHCYYGCCYCFDCCLLLFLNDLSRRSLAEGSPVLVSVDPLWEVSTVYLRGVR